MRFSNLDVKSRLHNYLRNYEFRTLNTCVTPANTDKFKKEKKMGKEPRKECKVRKVKKKKKGNLYQLSVAELPLLAPLISWKTL